MDSADKLFEILDYSINNIELNDEALQKMYTDFIQVYGNDFRHSYSEISRYLEGLYPDQRDCLENSLIKLIEYYDKNYSNSGNFTTFQSIIKLYDHIQLERIRLARVEQITRIVNSSKESLDKGLKMINDTELDIKEAEDKISNIHSETITILGIFAGLVIGFATSFQLFAQSFSTLNEVYFYKIIGYIAFIGIILFDSIFFLLFAVARISKRSLSINCKYEDCSNCDKDNRCKYAIQKANKKYPYVVWFNIGMILVLIIIAVWQFFFR